MKQIAVDIITNSLHAANKSYSHFNVFFFFVEYNYILASQKRLSVLSGYILDLLHVWEEYQPIQLRTEAIFTWLTVSLRTSATDPLMPLC